MCLRKLDQTIKQVDGQCKGRRVGWAGQVGWSRIFCPEMNLFHDQRWIGGTVAGCCIAVVHSTARDSVTTLRLV